MKNGDAEELLRKEIPGNDSQRACEVFQEEGGDVTCRYILCLDEKTRRDRLEFLERCGGEAGRTLGVEGQVRKISKWVEGEVADAR